MQTVIGKKKKGLSAALWEMGTEQTGWEWLLCHNKSMYQPFLQFQRVWLFSPGIILLVPSYSIYCELEVRPPLDSG